MGKLIRVPNKMTIMNIEWDTEEDNDLPTSLVVDFEADNIEKESLVGVDDEFLDIGEIVQSLIEDRIDADACYEDYEVEFDYTLGWTVDEDEADAWREAELNKRFD